MATATVDSACNHQNHLHTESIPLIDLNNLSQSELLALSFCSSSSSNSLRRLQTDTADVSTPKIDRSVFNESAGSRKQTFSRLRLRLAPRNNSLSSPSNSIPIVPFLKNTERQPLDEENSQIISLLKSLFGSDSHSTENKNENHHNLVSIPVIYNDYMCLPSTNNANFQNVPIGIGDSRQVKRLEVNHLISTRIAESSSQKRKRGRPRKNELVNLVNNELVEREKIENKMIVVTCDNVEVQSKKKEEMVMVNKNGVVVDFVALGNMEDPYGEELRKRTEGMQLKADFLGFLEGFEGEWGSTRKKRRIVDASVFGDALPIGWKLSICIKKQAGCVWLACTRYISPNGQQFVSCKEVSSYLLSSFGLHDVSKSNFGHLDGRIKLADKLTSSISADCTGKDGKNENDFTSYRTLPVTARSIETGGCAVQVLMGMNYKCHKCTMAFDKQDDLLQHLLSTHQRVPKRLRCGTSTNEEVIMKNGKYECQFCLKLFEERHRFNGHLGNHIKDYLKRLGASSGITTGKNNEPASTEIPPGAVKNQILIDIDRDSDAITSNTKTNDEINSTIPYCETKANTSVESDCDKLDRVFNISNDEVGKMNEVTAIVAAENRVHSEPALLNIENNVIHRTDETDVPKWPTNGIGDLLWEDKRSAGDVRNLGFIDYNNSNQLSPSLIEELNQERGFDSSLLAPNAKGNTFNDDIIEDRHCSSAIDNMVIDDQDIKGEPLTGCFVAMTENATTNLNEQRSSEGCSVADHNTGVLTSKALEAMQEEGSKGGLTGIENNMNSVCTGMSDESKFDDVGSSGTNELTIVCRANNTVLVDDNVASNEQGRNHGGCPVFSILNRQVHLVENNITGTPKCTIGEPCQEKESEGGLLAISANEQSCDLKGNAIKVSDDTINVANHSEVRCLKSNEFGSEIDPAAQTVTNTEQERSSNIFSFAPSTNGLIFSSKDYGICNSTLEKLRQGINSGHRPSHNEQSPDDENIVDGLSCTAVEEDKHQETKTSCNGELHIALGDSCTKQDTDVVTSTLQEGFLLFDGNQHTFTSKNNATISYTGTVDELKQKIDYVESVHCLSSSEPARSVEKNLLTAFTVSVQEESRVENSENPRKDDLKIGFNGQSRPNRSAVSEFVWRNDEENDLQSEFADTSCRPVQTSGSLPQYDAVSDKGESELFGEKFGAISGFEEPKSGGMDNLEFNLLTSQVSSNSDEPKVVSYDAVIPQGFDSSVWLEKEDLPFSPKNASWHHAPAVCVWCGREICQEAFESEGHTSSTGFMCTECTAKLSGQFSVQ